MKGVILAAGDGIRIRKVTYGAFPKELLPIGNVPTIRFPLETLKLVGVNKFLVVIAPQTKHAIIDGLQSGSRFGVSISYVVQEKNGAATGIGMALLSTRNWIEEGEDFMVACGDSIVCDFSRKDPLNCLQPLARLHEKTDALATVLVHPTESDPTRFGVVRFGHLECGDGCLRGRIVELIEKPDLGVTQTFRAGRYIFILTGYYLFNPRIFPYIEKTKPGMRGEIQITDAMALALSQGEKIFGVVHGRDDGNLDVLPNLYWDVGIPEDYKQANRFLLDFSIEALME